MNSPNQNRSSLAVIIPIYNERAAVPFLKSLISFFKNASGLFHSPLSDLHLVLVDDASRSPFLIEDIRDQVQDEIQNLAIQVHLLRHPINLGQGASLQTGISFVREEFDPDFYVTMDSDGQHQPADLPALLSPLQKDETDIVFGNRFQNGIPSGMPKGRLWILKAALGFERLITGIRLGDAHNGFRAFNRNCAQFLQIKQNRMAHATEIKQIVAGFPLRYAERPVTIRYTDETLKKGQHNIGSIHILKDLLQASVFEHPRLKKQKD